MILCLLVIRNEAYYLPGFFAHMRAHVDGFVVLDDGSIDGTLAIVRAEKTVLDVLHNEVRQSEEFLEHENRARILTRAKELGADWVICCDPDERFEQRFLDDLRGQIAGFEGRGKRLIAFKLREMWDSPVHFRIDGVWGRKTKTHMFKLPEVMTFTQVQYHGPWFPEELQDESLRLMTDVNVYHLKMIKAEDRIGRRDRYNKLDPAKKFQAIGYDYLTDERGIRLRKVPPRQAYDLETIPPDMRLKKLSWRRRLSCLLGSMTLLGRDCR